MVSFLFKLPQMKRRLLIIMIMIDFIGVAGYGIALNEFTSVLLDRRPGSRAQLLIVFPPIGHLFQQLFLRQHTLLKLYRFWHVFTGDLCVNLLQQVLSTGNATIILVRIFSCQRTTVALVGVLVLFVARLDLAMTSRGGGDFERGELRGVTADDIRCRCLIMIVLIVMILLIQMLIC